MRRFLITTALCLPTAVFAAGSDTSAPPTQTNTTTTCTDGKVWSEATQACVNPVQGSLDDDTLYGAARELAYAGQYGDALRVLAAMSDQGDDRVLTYLGFTHRKLGDVALGNAYYRAGDCAESRQPAGALLYGPGICRNR